MRKAILKQIEIVPQEIYNLSFVLIAVAVLMLFGSCSTSKSRGYTNNPHRHFRKALPGESPEQSKAALQAEKAICTHKSHKK